MSYSREWRTHRNQTYLFVQASGIIDGAAFLEMADIVLSDPVVDGIETLRIVIDVQNGQEEFSLLAVKQFMDKLKAKGVVRVRAGSVSKQPRYSDLLKMINEVAKAMEIDCVARDATDLEMAISYVFADD